MKKSSTCLSLIAVWAMVLAACAALASPIADWNFETTQPTTAGPISPEVGSGTGTSFHATAGAVYTNPIGNGSVESWSANRWSVGDYWQFAFNATGASVVQVDYDQFSSTAGPRDFELQYSTDGTNFVSYNQYSLHDASFFWTAGTPISETHYTATIPSLGNAATAYIRIVDNSTIPAGPSTLTSVTPSGTDRLDNVVISSVPEPGTALLTVIGLGFLGLIRRNARGRPAAPKSG